MRNVFQEDLSPLFGRDSGPERRRDLTNFLIGLSLLSGQEAECCEGPITAAKEEETVSDCGGDKLPVLDGLLYKLYCRMPDLIGYLLVCVYTRRQQIKFIPKSARLRVVVLLRMDTNKGIK